MDTNFQSTALLAAATHGHAGIVAELLRAGADASLTARDGTSALAKARRKGFAGVARALEAALAVSAGMGTGSEEGGTRAVGERKGEGGRERAGGGGARGEGASDERYEL